MSKLEFTATGGKVRISGNTNERTHCGKVKVYNDKIVIEQKGALLSKGSITVKYSNIDSISLSTMNKLHIVTESNDYYVSLLRAPSYTGGAKAGVKYIRKQIENIQGRPTEVNLNDKNKNEIRSVADEIEKLAELNDRGILTDEEFEQKKQELL